MKQKILFRAALFLATAFLHFFVSAYVFLRAEVVTVDAYTPYWRMGAKVLAFPLMYLLLYLNADLLLFMILNSALWAGVLVLVVLAVAKLKK